MELTERLFDFALYAHETFLNGDLQAKRAVLAALGSDYVLKGQNLTISYHNYFDSVIKRYPAIEAEYKRLELDETLTDKTKNSRFRGCKIILAGAVGVEPTQLVLETNVLPLYDAPKPIIQRVIGNPKF